MNYVKIPLQALFKLGETVCRKTSHIGYTPLNENISWGEVQFTKEDDAKIEYPIKAAAPPAPAPPTPPADVAPKKKAAKSAKKKARK